MQAAIRTRGLALWLGLWFGASCATSREPPKVNVPSPPPASPKPAAVKLAWLPLETRVLPELAGALNTRLPSVSVTGVSETFQAPVSMEMAQLAIECIERTPACWSAVGRSLGADKLLWADLERGERGASVTLRVSLFDVGGEAVLQKAEQAFPSTKAARDGLPALMDGAFPTRPTTAAAGGAP